MKIIMVTMLTLVACSESNRFAFNISAPKVVNTDWQRHNNLQIFDLETHSDGCSGGMSAIYKKLTFLHEKHGKILEWRQCCEVHDQAYYYGGTKQDKQNADNALNACVTQVIGDKYLGKAMQIAVEIGGGPNLPTSFRWGYGEDYIDQPD